MLIIISGVSGVGKNTMINELLKRYMNMYFFKTVTTRQRRQNETDHYFWTEEDFWEAEKRGEFFEYAEVHGFHYGTLYSELEKVASHPENIYIRDLDVHGNVAFRKELEGKVKVLSIFLEAPDNVLRQRLFARGETEERVNVRLQRAEMERTFLGNYDHIVENIDFEKTVATLVKIVDANLKK